MNTKTFLYDFLGCKVNSYECDAIAKILTDNGYTKANNGETPNVVVINTCSVTSISDRKSRKLIRHYRNEYPNSIIVAMGCFIQGSETDILSVLGANIYLGTSNRTKIIQYIKEYETNGKIIIDIDKDHRNFCYEKLPIINSCELSRAYVKIQDGCNNFCSYCLIPYVRGKARSREASEIVKEIKTLVEKGYKEIVLTGIDVASYGLDLDDKLNFSDLLELILTSVKDIYRIRISSIEESMIDDKFIFLLMKYPNIANHMHLSLQSGSNTVLKRMNRKYTTEEYYQKLLKIKEARPDINITTDVIVGFAGESEEEFNETCEFVKKCEFGKIHVFPYSRRKGTVAYSFKNQIDPNIKKERAKILLNISEDLSRKYEEKFYNKEIEFLVEDVEEKYFTAHSSNYLSIAYPKKENIHSGDIVKLVYNFDNVKK